MELDRFVEKFNKVDGNVYVIEEEVPVADGVYEAPLEHDNINPATLAVYTGPRLTGERVMTYTLSTPSLMPWKRVIRVYADAPVVYISYEADGDTVEAEDINRAQEAIVGTQEALNGETARATAGEKSLREALSVETSRAEREEEALEREIGAEIERAQGAERTLRDDLAQEAVRAKAAEKVNASDIIEEMERATAKEREISGTLTKETQRATAAEDVLTGNLSKENVRAKAAEKALEDGLAAESVRAKGAERGNTAAISAENIRAKAEEQRVAADLASETVRAMEAEKKNATGLTTEIDRAKMAERANSDAIHSEAGRAERAEKKNADTLAAETARAEAAEAVNSGAIHAESVRAQEAESVIRGTISTNKPVWEDKYTRNEVDNKFSALETSVDWKESVGTFADIAAAYPDPQDGWTVNVKDTDYTYRWSGTAWVAISANAIPKATGSVDGLLAKEDKMAYDDAYGKRHAHANKSVLDKLTETLLVNWAAAYTHVGDVVKHITSAERVGWNDANSKKHTHSNKGILDGITQALLNSWNTAFAHVSNKSNPHGVTKSQVGLGSVPNVPTNDQAPTYTQAGKLENLVSGEKLSLSLGKIMKALADFIVHKVDAVIHVTAAERTKWNAVTDKVDKVSGKGLSANDYTIADKNKLAGIAAGAEVNVQADWAVTDGNSDAYIRNRPAGYPPAAHTHSKSQITDFPESMPASDVAAWAKATIKPSYGWTEITGKPGAFAPAAHGHTKSQISDMPTKLSQFSNDSGYITQSDVDTSQNHTHANKSVLDKITQALLDKWNGKADNAVATLTVNGLMSAPDKKKLDGVAASANNYIHPSVAGSKHIPAGGASGQFLKWSADGTAVWGSDNNTTYGSMKGATAAASGTSGLVPAPAAGKQGQFLRGDGSWAVPVNTTYTHPDSGVVAGSYRSVTVNTQGHVTGGSNPTTLAGYGITDAAAKSHSHNGVYLEKGAVTWNDLKGV